MKLKRGNIKRSENEVNVSIKKHILFSSLLVIVLVTIMAVSLWGIAKSTHPTGQTVTEIISTADYNLNDPLTGDKIDFPTSNSGTFTGMVKENYFRDPIDDVILLFVSEKVPGLTIIYYPQQHLIVTGTPQLSIEGVSLFDGTKHEITYSFQKDGLQRFYYDRELLAQSKFELYQPSSLTGMVIGSSYSYVSPAVEAEIFD
ncbi:MAG TPA: hypothetical protein VJC39_04120 [Candidatus Nanoarchaeia archaeon]|nr:hypothetical protein [Candidatus Nanoarchaeia archaeon]